MNNSTSYSEYKPSTETQEYNVFSDEFLPDTNEFVNGRARIKNPERHTFLYEIRSLSFPANPVNYQSYVFGATPQQWIYYNGTWIPVTMNFALPAPKTISQVWLDGYPGYNYNPTNYTGENFYIDGFGTSYWGYGFVSNGVVNLSYSNISGNAWHPYSPQYTYTAGPLRTGVTYFGYGNILELKEVVIKTPRIDYESLVTVYDQRNLEYKKLPIEDYDNYNLLGTVTNSAFNVSEQSLDFPDSIGNQLKEGEFVYLVPKFFYIENNENKPLTISPVITAIPNTVFSLMNNVRLGVTEYWKDGKNTMNIRVPASFVGTTSVGSYIGTQPFRGVNFKKTNTGKYVARKTIEKIEWSRYRSYYSTTAGTYYGQYSYKQNLFDNPIESNTTWLTSSGSGMEFNVYKIKVDSRWKTGDEVNLVSARAPAERYWADYWGGSNDYNYFSWLDSRYVNLDTNEITVQNEGYIEDFKTGVEVETVGACNVIQGGTFCVVHQIFKTNQVLTPTVNTNLYTCNLSLDYGTSFLLTGQAIPAQNGFYYVVQTQWYGATFTGIKIERVIPQIDRSTSSYYSASGYAWYFGNNTVQASAPNTAGHVDNNIEAWRRDLYICVIKDYSEGHNGELTVYKQMQPWNGYEGLPGIEQTITTKQRKRLQSFYGNYQDGLYNNAAFRYENDYLLSVNNAWYAGSRYFASTFTELPDGLEDGGRYFLIKNGNKIKLAASYEDAIAGNPVTFQSVGKGAILIYRAKSNNTKTISTLKTVNGQEVETVLPPSQSCFLIKKDSGRFQLAETKAKALSGEALRLKVEPNTFLKLEKTVTDIQTGKYIWNPQETTALEPLNQKTNQVFYNIPFNGVASTDYTLMFPSTKSSVEFVQGYKMRLNLNMPAYDPAKAVDTPVSPTYRQYNTGSFLPGVTFIDTQSFTSTGGKSPTYTLSMYPNTLPEPPLNSVTIDGIKLEMVLDKAAHWTPLAPTTYYPYENYKDYWYSSTYVPSTYKIPYATTKAVYDNIMSKTLAYLGTIDFYLDRNTTEEQIRYTIFANGTGNNSPLAFAGRFTSFKNYLYETSGPVSYDGQSTMRGAACYELFFGGVTTRSSFKSLTHYGVTQVNTTLVGETVIPNSNPVQYSRYQQNVVQGETTFTDSEDIVSYNLRIAAMYAINKQTGEEYISLISQPITGQDGVFWSPIYLLKEEQRTYKKTGSAFVAVTSETGILPSQITLGDPYTLIDESKSFKLDFSDQVTHTWRKRTMVADPVPDSNNVGGEKYNRLSQLTSQDYQQTPSSFSGPVVCSYKPQKKIWSSSSLSSNGIPFKIEIVPQIRISSNIYNSYYYYSYTYYPVLISTTQASIKIYASPNEYKEFACLGNTKIDTYFPQDGTYTWQKPIANPNPPYNTIEYEPTVSQYSINFYQRTLGLVLTPPASITDPAGESIGPASSDSSYFYSGFYLNANAYNSSIKNNGYELVISEDTKGGSVLVKDDVFNIPWGGLQSLSVNNWVEYWSVDGTQRLTLDLNAGYVFKTKPTISINTVNGTGGEVEFYFTEGNQDIGLYNPVTGFRLYLTSSIIKKAGKYYFCASSGTKQNSTDSDYIKIIGTAYRKNYSSYYGVLEEVLCQIRIGFTASIYFGFPTNRSPTELEYTNFRTTLISNNINNYWANFSAPTAYPFLAKGVDNFTFMTGCSAPIAISHLTKVSIQ